MTPERAAELASQNVDYSTLDLFNAIEKSEFPSWTWYVQLIPEKDAIAYKWDVFDVTKVIP